MKAQGFVFFVSSVLAILVGHDAQAAEAVFSADGGKVYCCRYRAGELGVIDLGAKTYSVVHLKELKSLEVNGLARSNSGNILMTTAHAVWAWDPVKDKVVRVAEAGAKFSLEDLAYNPKTEEI